jgi:succinate dehydrogenase / fumarate reductase iron-sulfur subunit
VAKPSNTGTQATTPVRIVAKMFDYQSARFIEKEYKIEAKRLTTVLDALIQVKERIDQKLSFRYSCRMGICGSCAMVVNGKPTLACETNLLEVAGERSAIEVAPMQGHPLLKDLVTDFDDFFEKHKIVKPWLIYTNDKERYNNKTEMKQSDKERDEYLPFSECIKCGLCVDACPVANTNREFLGPQALAQAYRYYADSRDSGKEKRLMGIDTLEGAWGCEFSGSCSKVCPKSVDPALAIQLLKGEIAKKTLQGKM